MADAAQSTNLPATAAPGGGMAVIADNPWLRQLAVMVGIAASVALGVAVVLWSQAPSYAPLYGNLAEKEASEVMEALQQASVDYKVDEASGMLLVPAAKLKEIRMQLAGQGLPNSAGLGFELLQQDTGFGTSQIVERARHQQALQGELARTITTIGAVQSARVHLAVPKQSVFVRKRQPPSASVAVRLHNGRTLDDAQVEAIVHLVASSVPELTTGRVTVVDHKGRLLSGNSANREMKLSATQFEHTRRIEQHFRERIEDLLAPIVGRDKVRAQVTADVDFTVTEQTQERYNPDQPALRSERLNEEQRSGRAAGGVPGALTNQPPAAGGAPEQAAGGALAGDAGAGNPLNSSRQSTRNYELDRVISHTRMSPINLRRLSVAVVVDDISTVDDQGAVSVRERTPEEIERLTELVREAVGFDVRRGDSVRVMNNSFLAPEPVAELPEIPIWEQQWVLDIAKQVGGLVLVLVLIFFVLRPTLKRLTATTAIAAGAEGTDGQGARVEGPFSDGQAGGAGGAMLGTDGGPIQLPSGAKYENIMDAARQLVDEDPKRVAQLVKTWVNEEAA